METREGFIANAKEEKKITFCECNSCDTNYVDVAPIEAKSGGFVCPYCNSKQVRRVPRKYWHGDWKKVGSNRYGFGAKDKNKVIK